MSIINISPRAEQDLDEIYDYIGTNLASPAAAKKTVGKILSSIENLGRFPNIGVSLSDKINIKHTLKSHHRLLISDKYIIVYRFTEETVYVVRVLDGRTDYVQTLFSNDF